MSFATVVRKYPVRTAALCFALGAATAILGLWLLGTPWNSERVVEKPVERIVEKVVEKVPDWPTSSPDSRRGDLVVMQKGKPQGLDSEFREYFVEETRKLPGVEAVSEGLVGVANIYRDDNRDVVDDTLLLVQGWKPDNFGYETMEMVAGRKLQAGDRHKVLLGRILAENLKKDVGDKMVFVADPDNTYEVVGVFKSTVVFETGGAVVPFEDGQFLHLKKGKVTGFSVRVKKSPDPAAAVEEVRRQIEALRDPEDPSVRLSADPTQLYVQPKRP